MPSPSSTPGGVAAVMRTPGGPLSSSAPDRYVHYSTSPIVFNLQLDPTPPAVNNTNNGIDMYIYTHCTSLSIFLLHVHTVFLLSLSPSLSLSLSLSFREKKVIIDSIT